MVHITPVRPTAPLPMAAPVSELLLCYDRERDEELKRRVFGAGETQGETQGEADGDRNTL